ncbi:MAG: alpha-N-arabinofuranosidase, partial [Chitinophagaceae bacterium]
MRMNNLKEKIITALVIIFVFAGCNNEETNSSAQQDQASGEKKKESVSQPLVSHIYTADPSAHVFNNRIYIYPSHDTATGTKEDDLGSHFDMRDYHILSMDS